MKFSGTKKSVTRTLLLCVLAVLPSLVASDSHVVLPPLTSDKSLPVKMMVFIPGGNVPNANYAPTVMAVQQSLAQDVALWAVIPSVTNRLCVIECSTPSVCAPLKNSVEVALNMAVKKGWSRGNDKDDIYLAGHSLGGVCANTLMQAYDMPYAALMVFGSYVDEAGSDFSLTNYTVPVLTLNVELDGGLARPGKTSIWWRQFLDLSKADSTKTLLDKPVIILPSLNHSDFCPGFNVPGDLMAEVDQATATKIIGRVIAAYLNVQMNRASPPDAAVQTLSDAVDWTRQLMSPYLAAELLTVNRSDTRMGEGSSNLCRQAQLLLSGLSDADQKRVFVRDGFHVASSNLEHCHTNYTMVGQELVASTCSHTDYYADYKNTGSIEASSELACKLLSFDRLEQQLKVEGSGDVPCSAMNEQVVQMAMKLALPSTLQRYNAKGRKFCFLPDVATLGSIGPVWVFKDSLTLTANATCMQVASPVLQTLVSGKIYPGNKYCKFISPERVLDWMMTDSLKSK